MNDFTTPAGVVHVGLAGSGLCDDMSTADTAELAERLASAAVEAHLAANQPSLGGLIGKAFTDTFAAEMERIKGGSYTFKPGDPLRLSGEGITGTLTYRVTYLHPGSPPTVEVELEQ